MPRNDNSSKPDFGDWHNWVADGIVAVALGVTIGALFGWQVEKVGIFWGCVTGILLFALIGFWKEIKYFFRFLYRCIFNKK